MGQAVSAAQTLGFIAAMKAKTEIKISKDNL
jgi:biotin carboxyl carrier protein